MVWTMNPSLTRLLEKPNAMKKAFEERDAVFSNPNNWQEVRLANLLGYRYCLS
jgi:hypothetical protein